MTVQRLDGGFEPTLSSPKRRERFAWVGVVGRPLGHALAVSLCVVVVTFFLIHAFFGDPARRRLGVNVSEAAVQALRERWGLNRPLIAQFWDYLSGIFRGDLGTSIQGDGTHVSTLVFGSFANTALLAAIAMVFAIILGIAGGIWAATTRLKMIDALLRGASMISLSAPPALVGLVVLFVIAVRAGLAPVGGWGTGYPNNVRYLALPVISLTILMTPIILRVVRERALEVMHEPHIEAARARGMPPMRLLLGHLLPNCAVPIISVVGMTAGSLVSGAVIVEAVYGVPGLGQILLNAMNAGDYPVIQGAALVCGIVVALCNSLAEAVQRAVDVRVR